MRNTERLFASRARVEEALKRLDKAKGRRERKEAQEDLIYWQMKVIAFFSPPLPEETEENMVTVTKDVV